MSRAFAEKRQFAGFQGDVISLPWYVTYTDPSRVDLVEITVEVLADDSALVMNRKITDAVLEARPLHLTALAANDVTVWGDISKGL